MANPEFMEIDTQSVFESYLASAAKADRYAIDTEFHRERTYYPDLALLQMRFVLDSKPHAALIDPKAVDVSALQPLFTSDSVALVHAPLQDFEVFEHDVGILPSRFFDTQIAAGFLGFSTPSLASLVQHFMNVHLSKGDRLSDWTRRPLSPSQKRYAYSDVEHLETLVDSISAELDRLGRLPWASSAFEELVTSRRPPLDPDDAWRSITEGRNLQEEQKGVLMELAAWRERRARELNIPPRRVYSDIVLVCLAQRMPQTPEEFDEVRGFTRTRNTNLAPLQEAIRKGRNRRVPPPLPRQKQADPRAVALVSAFVGDLAHRQKIDKVLLATREDLELLLAGIPSRLDSSWRAEILQDIPARIASGSLGLAIDPDGGFRLVQP